MQTRRHADAFIHMQSCTCRHADIHVCSCIRGQCLLYSASVPLNQMHSASEPDRVGYLDEVVRVLYSRTERLSDIQNHHREQSVCQTSRIIRVGRNPLSVKGSEFGQRFIGNKGIVSCRLCFPRIAKDPLIVLLARFSRLW